MILTSNLLQRDNLIVKRVISIKLPWQQDHFPASQKTLLYVTTHLYDIKSVHRHFLEMDWIPDTKFLNYNLFFSKIDFQRFVIYIMYLIYIHSRMYI